MGQPVPPEEGVPIYEAAVRAKDAGRRIFLAAVTVEYSAGGMGVGGNRTSNVEHWDSSDLIEAIENLGWHLEDVDHVWRQTGQSSGIPGAAIVKGLTIAYLRFRRTQAPQSSTPQLDNVI